MFAQIIKNGENALHFDEFINRIFNCNISIFTCNIVVDIYNFS